MVSTLTISEPVLFLLVKHVTGDGHNPYTAYYLKRSIQDIVSSISPAKQFVM